MQNKVVKAALDTKADASALAAKQDALTAGQNVTISGNTISADVDSAEIAADVTDWLDENVNPVGSAVVVDSSLSVEGAAADAKATGAVKNDLTAYEVPTVRKSVSDFEQADYTVASGYYDTYEPTVLKQNANYSNIKLAVSKGDFLLVSTRTPASSTMAMLLEYDADFQYLGCVNTGTDETVNYTDEPYIVKGNVRFVTVSSIYVAPIIKIGTVRGDLLKDIDSNQSSISHFNKGNIAADVTNLISNGNMTSMSSWNPRNSTGTTSDNVLTLTGNGGGDTIGVINTTRIDINSTLYFVAVDVMVTDSSCSKINLSLAGGYAGTDIIKPVANKWYTVAAKYQSPHSGTQNACIITAYYDDATAQSGKVLKLRKCIGIQTNVDFGLGTNPPMYKLMGIVANNDYWSGTGNVIINQFKIGDSLNHSDEGFLLKNRNAYQSVRRPVVTFVCDDGWQADYNKLVAISEKHSVPFTSAIFDGSTMNEWNELYLQNYLGWEFASHPGNSPLADKATEAEIEEAMVNTNQYLTNRGLKYYNLVYPYGSHDERVRRIAKKFYRCACTTDPNGLNKDVVASFALHRCPMGYGSSSNTLENFKAKVDEAVTNTSWLIFMLHPNMEQHTDELTQIIDDLITYIKSIGVDILTLNDGYDIFGNALECGDYLGGTDGIAISFNGEKANI